MTLFNVRYTITINNTTVTWGISLRPRSPVVVYTISHITFNVRHYPTYCCDAPV